MDLFGTTRNNLEIGFDSLSWRQEAGEQCGLDESIHKHPSYSPPGYSFVIHDILCKYQIPHRVSGRESRDDFDMERSYRRACENELWYG
jgi:hypothetical protein